MTVKSVQHYRQKIPQYYDFLPSCAVEEFKFTEEASYSVSPFTYAFQTAQFCNFIMTSVLGCQYFDVLDMTQCVGGDTMAMAFFARHVESYEINKQTFECFINNRQVLTKYGFGQQVSKISSYNESSVDHIESLQTISSPFAAVIDPPWGGPEFKMKQNIRLKLGDVEIESIVGRLLARAQVVVLKLPSNYDVAHLAQQLDGHHTITHTHRNILCIFVFQAESLTEAQMQQIDEYTERHSFLQVQDLLAEARFETYERTVRSVLQYNLASTMNLRANFRRIIEEAKKRRQMVIKVNKRLRDRGQLEAVIGIAVAVGVSYHLCSTLYFIDDDQRLEAEEVVQNLPPYLQMFTGNYPSIWVSSYRVNNPLISIGENHDQHAFFCFVLSGQACNIKFLRGEYAVELFDAIVSSYSSYTRYCRSLVGQQGGGREELQKLLQREILMKDEESQKE